MFIRKENIIKKKLSLISILCVLVMLFSTISVNAAELAYGAAPLNENLTYTDVLAMADRGQLLVTSRETMNAIMPQSINSTCYFEVIACEVDYIEWWYDGSMISRIDDDIPSSVRVYEPASGHYHQGYLTTYYVDKDLYPWDDTRVSGGGTYRNYELTYHARIVFYGYLECLS